MIPSYKEMMLPILEFVAQNNNTNRSEIYKFIINQFKLNDEDLLQRIKRGTPTYINRADWALTYLATTVQVKAKPKMKPLEKVGKSLFSITNFGKELIRKQKRNLYLGMMKFISKRSNKKRKKQ